jgi:HAE1 family hydrophobic/amphiphilic exporter-1
MAMLVWSMKHRLAMSLISLGTIVAIVPMFMLTGKDFIPQDDQSQFEVNVRAPKAPRCREAVPW